MSDLISKPYLDKFASETLSPVGKVYEKTLFAVPCLLIVFIICPLTQVAIAVV